MTLNLSGWSELVAAADPALVLPSGERRASVAVPGPLALEALHELGEGHAVAVVRSADAARWTVPLLRDAAGLHRSRPGDGTAERLVAALAAPSAEGVAGGPFAVEFFHAEAVSGERGITVDQTNESVIVGERAVVKWAVRLPDAGEPGSPAGRRIAALARGGFAEMPRAWGLLSLVSQEGEAQPVDEAGGSQSDAVLLAGVVAYLPGARDGWEWAVDDVRRLASGEMTLAQALEPARLLGGTTARMHAALAAGGRTVATAAQVADWAARMRAELDEAVALVGGEEGRRLKTWAPRIAEAYAELDGLAGTPLIDVHGDFHVGQVLRAPGTEGAQGAQDVYAVVDFDGNPVLPAGQRAARQPAALDAVGMAASLDHVGRVVIHRTPDVDPEPVRAWIAAAQRAFLDAYRATLATLGVAELLDERLTRPLRLAQEVREYLYAVRHLPHWVYVPDLSLTDLLKD